MAIGSISPFRPTGTVNIAATTTSQTIALTGGGETVVAINATAALAYVRFGSDASVTASTVDMPLLPNSRAVLSVNSLIGFAAAVLANGTGTILFTRGDGSYI
jgi:hypothetical protein